jgi:hypothetical protein
MKDSLGIEIQPTDRVIVTSYGYNARLIDCGIQSPVVRINRKRVVITDCEDQQRAVAPFVLTVCRRDGQPGYEAYRTAAEEITS